MELLSFYWVQVWFEMLLGMLIVMGSCVPMYLIGYRVAEHGHPQPPQWLVWVFRVALIATVVVPLEVGMMLILTVQLLWVFFFLEGMKQVYPCHRLAAELIPEYLDMWGWKKWEVVEDVEPTLVGDCCHCRFDTLLETGDENINNSGASADNGVIGGDEIFVSDQVMLIRAIERNALLGLVDVKILLTSRCIPRIPVDRERNYLLFRGTVLRGPNGHLYFPYIYSGSIYFARLGIGFGSGVRLVSPC